MDIYEFFEGLALLIRIAHAYPGHELRLPETSFEQVTIVLVFPSALRGAQPSLLELTLDT